jgi:hypothetical protein
MIVFAQEKQPAASGWMSRSEADRAKQLHAGPGLSWPLKKPHPLRFASSCMCLTKSVGGRSLSHLRGSGSKTIDGRLPISLRRSVFDLYGIRAGEPTSYDVDHLLPVSLGGANSLKIDLSRTQARIGASVGPHTFRRRPSYAIQTLCGDSSPYKLRRALRDLCQGQVTDRSELTDEPVHKAKS